MARPEVFGTIPGEGRLEALAVAGHHRFLSAGHLFDVERFANPIEWEPDAASAVTAAKGLAKEMFLQHGWKIRFAQDTGASAHMLSNLGQHENHPFQHLLSVKDDLARQAAAAPKAAVFRELLILLKGMLMTADWMASGAKGEDPFQDARKSAVHVRFARLIEHMARRHEARRRENPDLPIFAGYRPFQSECAQAEGHLLAVAPTGSGKTEAAMAWALGQVNRGRVRKILFLMPTMITANSIHERMAAFFGEERHRVGLVHSTADLVRDAGRDEQAESDRADVRADLLAETHFFYPVTVATIDQLLVPLFHAGHWAMKTSAAASSAVVLDEIHAYDPHTTGLILTMIRQLRDLGARFLVMSATMPSSLRSLIQSTLSQTETGAAAVTIVEEKTLLDHARNSWATCASPLRSWILDDAETERPRPSARFRSLLQERNARGNPVRVLIVVNTVEQCQTLARQLHTFRPFCYHSKFIFRDRRKKERKITQSPPRILIATQVVEVSLDIDYDVLLTECAPLDALVQRVGGSTAMRAPSEGGSSSTSTKPRASVSTLIQRTFSIARGHCSPRTMAISRNADSSNLSTRLTRISPWRKTTHFSQSRLRSSTIRSVSPAFLTLLALTKTI